MVELRVPKMKRLSRTWCYCEGLRIKNKKTSE
jgi:hypothetical protein